MESNKIIIGLLVIIILILAVGIGLALSSNNQNNDSIVVNNTTDDNEDSVVNATLKSDYSQSKHYDDWQKDYETGEYDEFGSPIYRSVISTSGGQYEPGIYESYWSENGPISEERIG